MFWNQYPYINLNDLNLDFLLKAIGEMQNEVKNFVTLNAVKYANPIQWSISTQYEKNTIVIDPNTGTAYISVQPVPSGVALNRTEYWTPIFDLGSFVVRAAKNFSRSYEAETTTTATFNTAAGGWFVWGDTLYRALVNITAGDSYVVGGNIAHITMEEVKDNIMNYIGYLDTLTTVNKSNLVAAINEVNGNVGDLNTLTTTNKSSTVAATNEVNGNVGDLNTLTTTNKSSAVAAINEVNGNVGDLNTLTTTNKSSTVAAIDEVNHKIDRSLSCKIVAFGDSWLEGGGWLPTLAAKMGATETHNYGISGTGFARPGFSTFHDQLDASISELTADVRSNITHVIIGGGINDQWDVEADLYTAANTMFEDCKSAYPNAKIYYFANHGSAIFTSDYYSRITNLYNRAISKGVIVLEHVVYCMMGAGAYYINADMVHPTIEGYNLVSDAIFSNMTAPIQDYLGSVGANYKTTIVNSRINRRDNIVNINIKFTPTNAGDIPDGLYCGTAPLGADTTAVALLSAPIISASSGATIGNVTISNNGIQAWGVSAVTEKCYVDISLNLVGIYE